MCHVVLYIYFPQQLTHDKYVINLLVFVIYRNQCKGLYFISSQYVI